MAESNEGTNTEDSGRTIRETEENNGVLTKGAKHDSELSKTAVHEPIEKPEGKTTEENGEQPVNTGVDAQKGSRGTASNEEQQNAADPTDLNMTVDPTTAEQLARGEVTGNVLSSVGIKYHEIDDDTKLEDLSMKAYRKLETIDPERASNLLTDYNDRHMEPDDLSAMSRQLQLDNRSGMEVIDPVVSGDKATVKDTITGATYTVYPNPMGRMSHMDGQQGQNSLGMHQDCGIASTAKGINDLYGKRVTSEERLAKYAYTTGNCTVKRNVLGVKDIWNSGGTDEGDVEAFYKANGLEAMKFAGSVPTPEVLGDHIQDGGVVTLAVNHDLMWNWEKAQAFNPATDLDRARYQTDARYRSHVHDLMRMKNGGTFQADHFVNVSNVVYDDRGNVSHFIVSDTGNGTTKMISREDLYRAYNGNGAIGVSARGCVMARRKS